MRTGCCPVFSEEKPTFRVGLWTFFLKVIPHSCLWQTCCARQYALRAKKDSIISLPVSRPFCPSARTDIQAFRGSSIIFDLSVSSRLQALLVHVHVFRGSRRHGSGIQIFALLIRTVVVHCTQVSQVRIEGTELWKRYGKKEMKKCAISSKQLNIPLVP